MPFTRYFIYAAAFTLALIGCVHMHATLAGIASKKSTTQAPLDMKSHLGSYLAGGLAYSLNDASRAVEFYRRALRSAPDEPSIVARSFIVEASEGHLSTADKMARKVVALEPDDRVAQLWLGVMKFRAGHYKVADTHFKRASVDPLGELTAQLARAWIALARQKPDHALRLLSPQPGQTWSAYYISYHRALAADLAARPHIAQKAYNEIFKADARTARTTAAYIRHAIKGGRYGLAGQIARQHISASANGGDASIVALFADIKHGRPAELIVQTPHDGLAEVFYGLGEALIAEGGLDLGVLYLRMAQALKPKFPNVITALASAYETMKNHKRAIALFDSIDAGTALDMEIAIRKAMNLDAMGETDKAKQVLDAVIASHPGDIRPLHALGNILRIRKRYQEAIAYYSQLIDLLPSSENHHWIYWYARGTSYERIKQWPNAEKDLLKALQLNPNQALVLNYLGYSWVDQNIYLSRGLELIQKAVSLKPDDGYIVDSFGWAHYRLGNFEKAVSYLERAVELEPQDPVLNDHLGDALWQVNRRREAQYQWKFALTLQPEEEDAVKIRKKLVSGLPPQPILKAPSQNETRRAVTAKIGKRADNDTLRVSPVR